MHILGSGNYIDNVRFIDADGIANVLKIHSIKEFQHKKSILC